MRDSEQPIDPRIAAEFGSVDRDPIDEREAGLHLRAVAHLEALGADVDDEQSYLASLEVVAANAVAPRDELERRLEVATAIGELAEHRLAETIGVPTEQEYLDQVAGIETEFHLKYDDWAA